MNLPQLHSGNSTFGFLCCPLKWPLIEMPRETGSLQDTCDFLLPFLGKMDNSGSISFVVFNHAIFLHPFPNLHSLFFLRVIAYMCGCLSVHIVYGAQKRALGHWNWSYGWLWTAWCRSWDLNPGPLQQQQVLLTAISLALPFRAFF